MSPECRKTRSSYLRNSLVVWIGDDSEQFINTAAPDRCNDPELGKMGPDRIDYRSLLTDEQMPCAVEHIWGTFRLSFNERSGGNRIVDHGRYRSFRSICTITVK